MDVKYVNPFIQSFNSVMPQLGFNNVRIGKMGAKKKDLVDTGVVIILGIVGDVKGNVVYTLSVDSAKRIASTMMMGMPIEQFDDMAKSALQELTNMLTANAATFFSNIGITIDISTPTLLQGENISIKMNSEPVLCVQLLADDIAVDANISFEN